MASSADVERSSQKKAAAAERARTAVLDRLARDEGDVFRQGMETHRRTMFTAYGHTMRYSIRLGSHETDYCMMLEKLY